METLNFSLMLVILSAILITGLLILILRAKSKNQLQKIFAFDLICVLIISVGVALQEIFSKKFNVNPMFFEYFIYIGTCFLPIGIYFTGLIFANTKIKMRKSYLLLFIIPIITLLVLWTNNFHHMFFKNYSTNLSMHIWTLFNYSQFIYLLFNIHRIILLN